MRTHDVNPGASLDSARGNGFAGLGVPGTRCRVDRDRAATRRFSHDRIAIYARHSHRLARAMCSRCGGQRLVAVVATLRDSLRAIVATLREGQRLGAVGIPRRDARGLRRADRRTHDRACAQGEREGKGKAPNQEPSAPSSA